jgi:hypothetical protein
VLAAQDLFHGHLFARAGVPHGALLIVPYVVFRIFEIIRFDENLSILVDEVNHDFPFSLEYIDIFYHVCELGVKIAKGPVGRWHV